jgi:spermidine synthase
MARRASIEQPPAFRVDTGTAALDRDPDRPRGRTLVLDGIPQSHVDLDDPTWLEFDYVRRLGHVVDLLAPAGQPLDVVHLGGGGLTLARYVAATRPRSRQRVFEHDGALIELVRAQLPLEREARSRVRVRCADARAGLASLPADSADLVLADVFAGARTPGHLTSVEFVSDAARVLRPGGCHAVNVADGRPLAFARAQVATLAEVFPHVCLIAEPAVLRGRRFGNLVVVGSSAALPDKHLARRTAGDPMPARVLVGTDLSAFARHAGSVTDAVAAPSPIPPAELFGRRSAL